MNAFRKSASWGGITLLVLVFLIMFVVISSALLRFISLQSHDATNREQRERTFYFAESGAHYFEWILSATGPGKPVSEVIEPVAKVSPLPGGQVRYTTGFTTYNHYLYDAVGDAIGEFFVNATKVNGNTVTVETVAYPNQQVDQCRSHSVDLQRLSDDTYGIVRLEELPQRDVVCPSLINECAAQPLDVQGRNAVLQLTSYLSADDCVPVNVFLGANSPSDHYSWRADRFSQVHIFVESDDFQPFITLIQPNGTSLSSSSCPGYIQAACIGAHVYAGAPVAGTYGVRVSSETAQQGEYKLSFTAGTALPN